MSCSFCVHCASWYLSSSSSMWVILVVVFDVGLGTKKASIRMRPVDALF